MLAVTGYRSTIVQELKALLPEGEEIKRLPAVGILDDDDLAHERYLLCAGILRPQTLLQQALDDINEAMRVNLIRPMQLCDHILGENENARICVVGSESGFAWSYDGTYAAAKAGLHRYVETKKLKPNQQLVCVAPSIIENSGMTMARTDIENLAQRKENHVKKRFLQAVEVARLIHFLLYIDEGYLSGQVIRLNGGV